MKRKNIWLMTILFSVLIIMTGCISIPIGDGDSIKLSKDGVSFQSDDGESVDISLDKDDGKISMKGTDKDGAQTTVDIDEESGIVMKGTDEEGEEQQYIYNQQTEVPAEFPSDVPIPDEAEILSGLNIEQEGEQLVSVDYRINDNQLKKYKETYRKFLKSKGFAFKSEAEVQQRVSMETEGKDNVKYIITIDGSNEDHMYVSIMYLVENSE